MKIRRTDLAVLFAVAAVVALAQTGFAEEYGDKIESNLRTLISWVTKALGGAAVIGGLVWTGIRMSMGDENAIKSGLRVIGGGILIFSAEWILNMLSSIFSTTK